MNLKSKVFGFAAASVLALSMTTGVMAADDDSANISGSATLVPGICQIDVTQSNTNFGTWKYDGDKYVHVGGSNVSMIGATLKAAEPNGKCDVTVSMGAGLKKGTDVIAPSNFKVTYGSDSAYLIDGFGHTFENISPDSGSGLELKLEKVPNNPTGDYSGDIVLVVVNAS